jgi:Family of unknown function (DUF6331)
MAALPSYAGDVVNEIEGEGWRPIRPTKGHRELISIDHLIPDADWFWHTLQRDCVPDCCGLAAYDFSAESVAWACGWGRKDPGGVIGRDPRPGDVPALVARLREAASAIRDVDAEAVSANLFNDILTPASYANLLDDLASKASPRR